MRATVFLVASLTAALANAATHHVTIQSMSFSPSQLTIAPGDTVTWTLQTGFHTTTSDTGVWDSGGMGAGQTFSHTFPSAGTFPYHCEIHSMMTAVITVAASSKVGTTTSPRTTRTSRSSAT
jgi:plastocyanin